MFAWQSLDAHTIMRALSRSGPLSGEPIVNSVPLSAQGTDRSSAAKARLDVVRPARNGGA